MKILFTLIISLMSSVALSCTNFSGEYQTENLTYYSISQNGCENMDVSDETGSTRMFFDGIERQLYEYEIVVDGQVLASVTGFLSGSMKADQWVYHERAVTIYSSGETTEEKKWAEVSINEETDLLTVLHNADGTVEQFIDRRMN